MEYIVRSGINPKLILATNGEFKAPCFLGPGALSAKSYKTIKGAAKYHDGFVYVEGIDEKGIPTGKIFHAPPGKPLALPS